MLNEWIILGIIFIGLCFFGVVFWFEYLNKKSVLNVEREKLDMFFELLSFVFGKSVTEIRNIYYEIQDKKNN